MGSGRDKQPTGELSTFPAPWSEGARHGDSVSVFDGVGRFCGRSTLVNANLIISSPWVYALFWALRNGWSLEQRWFADKEGKVTGKGYEVITNTQQHISWVSQWDDTAPDFDQQMYNAIKAAMREQEQQ